MAFPVNTRWPPFFQAPVEQQAPMQRQPERFGGPNLQNALAQQGQEPDEYDGDDIEEYDPDEGYDGLDPMSDFTRQQGQLRIASSFAGHGMGISTPMMVALAGNDRAARAEAWNRRRQMERDKLDLALKRQEFGIRREELELKRLQLQTELAEKLGPSAVRTARLQDEQKQAEEDNETDYSTGTSANRRPRAEDGKF